MASNQIQVRRIQASAWTALAGVYQPDTLYFVQDDNKTTRVYATDNATTPNAYNVTVGISDANSKTTPADADTLVLSDSAASNIQKKFSFSNLKTWVMDLVNWMRGVVVADLTFTDTTPADAVMEANAAAFLSAIATAIDTGRKVEIRGDDKKIAYFKSDTSLVAQLGTEVWDIGRGVIIRGVGTPRLDLNNITATDTDTPLIHFVATKPDGHSGDLNQANLIFGIHNDIQIESDRTDGPVLGIGRDTDVANGIFYNVNDIGCKLVLGGTGATGARGIRVCSQFHFRFSGSMTLNQVAPATTKAAEGSYGIHAIDIVGHSKITGDISGFDYAVYSSNATIYGMRIDSNIENCNWALGIKSTATISNSQIHSPRCATYKGLVDTVHGVNCEIGPGNYQQIVVTPSIDWEKIEATDDSVGWVYFDNSDLLGSKKLDITYDGTPSAVNILNMPIPSSSGWRVYYEISQFCNDAGLTAYNQLVIGSVNIAREGSGTAAVVSGTTVDRHDKNHPDFGVSVGIGSNALQISVTGLATKNHIGSISWRVTKHTII